MTPDRFIPSLNPCLTRGRVLIIAWRDSHAAPLRENWTRQLLPNEARGLWLLLMTSLWLCCMEDTDCRC